MNWNHALVVMVRKMTYNFSEDSRQFSAMHSKHGKIAIKAFKDHFKLTEHEDYFVVDYLL